MNFLRNPQEIRKELHNLQGRKQLDVAVAFVGADWSDILSGHTGKVRLICWLSSTNTNPYAVASLLKRPRTEVRQRDAMHCKVYLPPDIGAIVGSANLSKQALDEADTAGQSEAALLVSAASPLTQIKKWFQKMWDHVDTRNIRRPDIEAAKLAYDRARAGRPKNGQRKKKRRQEPYTVPFAPGKLTAKVRKYAMEVKEVDLRAQASIGYFVKRVRSITPKSMSISQRKELIDLVVTWTGHPGSYEKLRRAPISRVRLGLQLLFDESSELQPRLEKILREGYLPGLRMPTLSLLLYWRYPEAYPPFNMRTGIFLKDFKMRVRGMSGSSPRCYSAWLGWATRLHQRLGLPTTGHVDRLIERYYEETQQKL